MEPATDNTAVGGSGQMFDRIADRYDLLNRILSLGIDRGWRKRAVAGLGCSGPCRILDLATGTADLAIAIADGLPGSTVVGIDPSEGMLAVGQRKIQKRDLADRIALKVGDGQALPEEDGSFDAAVIGFGIRNIPDRLRALREMARVTRQGGTIGVLELGEPDSGALAALARLHVHVVVPAVGGLLSGRHEYAYLTRSIAAFPPSDVFCEVMEEAGLRHVSCERLTFGAVNLFLGRTGPPRAAAPDRRPDPSDLEAK